MTQADTETQTLVLERLGLDAAGIAASVQAALA